MMKRKMLIHLFGLMALLLLPSGHSFAQNLRVQGRVLDELGEGLIGAGVYASHGYERSHIDGVYNTLKVLCGYLGA